MPKTIVEKIWERNLVRQAEGLPDLRRMRALFDLDADIWRMHAQGEEART